MREFAVVPLAVGIHDTLGRRVLHLGHTLERMLHVGDPHRKTQAATRFLGAVAHLAGRVVTDPGHGREPWLESGKPGVHGVVGGARLAKQVRALERALGAGGGARAGHFLQQAVHDEGIAGVDGAHRFVQRHRPGFQQGPTGLFRHLGDDPGVDPVAAVGEHRVCGSHLHRRDRPRAQGHRQVGQVLFFLEAKARDPVPRVLRSDRLQDADRHHVLRACQCRAHAHRAVELAVVVLGFPGLPAGHVGVEEQCGVVDERGGREALFQGGRVDEGLEARTRLAPGLRDMVELVLVVVEPAHKRPDGATGGVDRDKGALDLGQLGDFPGAFRCLRHPDHRAAADADVGLCLFIEA